MLLVTLPPLPAATRMLPFALVALGAFALAVAATPAVAGLARRFGVVDVPDVRKVHAVAVPRLGGLAIVASVLLVTLVAIALDAGLSARFADRTSAVLALLGAGVFVAAVGAVDDVVGLRARHKLFAQVLAASVLCVDGLRIDEVVFADGLGLQLGWLSGPVTVLWLVGVTNAMNLIDGLDGLASGLAAIAASVVAVLAIQFGQPLVATLMLALAGALGGFLVFNHYPARVFMGDSGSLFLGFTLGGSVLLVGAGAPAFDALAIAAVALGIPLLDTAFAMTRRFLEQRSIFAADRNHLHHRMLDLGYGHRTSVWLLWGTAALATGVAFAMRWTGPGFDAVLFAIAVGLLVGVFRHFGAVRLRDAFEALRLRRQGRAVGAPPRPDFDSLASTFAGAATIDQWWSALVGCAERLGFHDLRMVAEQRDGGQREFVWQTQRPNRETDAPVLEATLPIAQRRPGNSLRAHVAIATRPGAPEWSASRLATLGRLLDSFSVATLPIAGDRRERIAGSA